MLLNKIRYYGFWLIDALKGFKVKNHLKEIEKVQQNFSSDESQSLQQSYMNNLLKHATSTTDFYKPYSDLDLNNFPVINKNIIRNRRRELESKVYINKVKKHVWTSGSTGATIKVYHNKNKINRNKADNLYFYNKVNFKLGQKLLYIRIWWEPISNLSKWQKNILPIDILLLNDQNYILKVIDEITNNKEVKSIIGYASALEKICVFLDSNNYKPIYDSKIKSIIAVAESLSSYTKERINYYFNTNVYSRYSNSENGIFAQQLPYSKSNFIINWASYFIEILKLDADTPAESGEKGRIVITDLFSFGIPMIRYDTGDIGAVDYSLSPPVFISIEGRKFDIIFNTKGEIVSSMIIVRPSLSDGVIQSQLIQEGKKKYVLKLNVTKSFTEELIIINKFKSILGNDSIIKVEYVNDIPVLVSGKRRSTINNYIK